MPVLNPGAGPTLARFTQTPRATSPGNTLLVNRFEGGTSGVTVSPGNSGGTAGNAFDAAVAGTGCTLAYDNARAAHGTVSCQVATTSTATSSTLRWSVSLGAPLTRAWFRLYLYFTANPAVNTRVFTVLSGGANAAFLNVTTAGTIVAQDSTNATMFTTTSAIPLGQWFRIEGFVAAGASAGQAELRLFLTPDNPAADETKTSAATFNTLASFGEFRYGIATPTVNIGPYWMDDLGASSTDYLGPAATLDLGGSDAPKFHPGAGPTLARFWQTPRDTGPGSFAAPALGEAGTGTETLAVTAAAALAEAGSAADTLAIAAAVPLVDAGSAAEATAVAAAVPLAETGTGAEALTAAVSSVQSGTVASWFHPGAGPSAARFFQTPRATDTPAGIISLPETGAAADSLTVTAAVPLAEAGPAADTLAVTAAAALADAGSAADTLSVAVTVPLADAGSAADTVLITAAVPLAELASAADTLAVSILSAAVLPDGVRPGGFHPGPGPTLARFWTSPRASDTPVPALAFTVGVLSASDAPAAVLTASGASSALTASTAPSGTLTTATQTTGGPS